MKKSYTLYICILFTIVSSAQTISKDSTLQKEFNLFVSEMNNYMETNKMNPTNDTLSSVLGDCYNYCLIWIVEKNGGPSSEITRGDSLKNLCSMVDYFKKVNESTLHDESKYGLWYYQFTAIGNKYLIVDGDQAVGREVHRWYYYVRKGE